jgi:hypothetical protein
MGAVIAASIAALLSLAAVVLQVKNANTDQTRQLTFQGRQDRRVIYAAALAALRKYSIEHTEDCETTARIAVGVVELVAPYKVWWPTHVVLNEMCLDAALHDKAWERMVQQMRDDLGVKGAWQATPVLEASPAGPLQRQESSGGTDKTGCADIGSAS